jgi:hypothetical protein
MASAPSADEAVTWSVRRPVKEDGRSTEIDVSVHEETCREVDVVPSVGVAST